VVLLFGFVGLLGLPLLLQILLGGSFGSFFRSLGLHLHAMLPPLLQPFLQLSVHLARIIKLACPRLATKSTNYKSTSYIIKYFI